MNGRPQERLRDAAAAVAARVLDEADLTPLWRSVAPETAARLEHAIREWAKHLRGAAQAPDLIDKPLDKMLLGFGLQPKD